MIRRLFFITLVLSLAVFLVMPTFASAAQIPGNIYGPFYATPGNAHYYQIVATGYQELTWDQAVAAAEALPPYVGTYPHLATITSSGEQAFIAGLQGANTRLWLGASDAAIEGTWTWITGEPFVYSNWIQYGGGNAEPNGGTVENYLEWLSGGWADVNSQGPAMGYIVEYEASPEMSVEGNNVVIVDGDATPSSTDGTDFGSADITTGSVVHTFTIKNTGSEVLNLTGSPIVVVGGANAADFTVNPQPSSSIDVAGSATFNVTFDPSATGLRTANLSIDNNDPDANPYTFSIQGTGFQSVSTATGTGTATFSTSNGILTNLTAMATTPCGSPPPGFIFPHGFFSFNITDITPGSTITVTITLPSAVPVGTQYWKCMNGSWVNVTSLLGDNDGDNVLTLTIKDGGLGDADGHINGNIVDPGGPAVPQPSTPTPMGVGGEVKQVDRSNLIIPWLALALVIITLGVISGLGRRKGS